jgi:UDP-N-acetyl-D-glucosamine dehydrogenase
VAAEHRLSLAVNGRERLLADRLTVLQPVPVEHRPKLSAVVVGLGYVGLPTAYALSTANTRVVGFDISEERLRAIKAGEVDLPPEERRGLNTVLSSGMLQLTCDPAELSDADVVIISVPTPVDEDRVPDTRALRSACRTVVENAQPGQTIVLTSTTYVGTTREMLVEPLQQRGLRVGSDVFVAFSPERIDPGNYDHTQRETPRVVGGVTRPCSEKAAEVINRITDSVYLVSSPEAAELTKLYENIFRAVNLALANEIADACSTFDLDPIEVTIAAGTKPYGFLGSFPGPGVGGHCIPCDPHYLLWQLRREAVPTPLIEQAMESIDRRPGQIAHRVLEELTESGIEPTGARVIIAGVSYKAGVQDLRESPALPIISELRAAGVETGYFDPLIPEVELPGGVKLFSEKEPSGREWDLVLVHTVHPDVDFSWISECSNVIDATYQFDAVPHRKVP